MKVGQDIRIHIDKLATTVTLVESITFQQRNDMNSHNEGIISWANNVAQGHINKLIRTFWLHRPSSAETDSYHFQLTKVYAAETFWSINWTLCYVVCSRSNPLAISHVAMSLYNIIDMNICTNSTEWMRTSHQIKHRRYVTQNDSSWHRNYRMYT